MLTSSSRIQSLLIVSVFVVLDANGIRDTYIYQTERRSHIHPRAYSVWVAPRVGSASLRQTTDFAEIHIACSRSIV